MAFMDEISKYKNTIAMRILEERDLCKAIYYNDENFLEQPDIDFISESDKLLYKHIFPYRFIPDTDENVSTMKTYVTICTRRFELSSSTFKNGYIYINAFTHRDLFKTAYGKTRIDDILNQIEKIMNSKRGIGLGKLEFDMMDELVINDKYQGAYLSYRPVDFNIERK